MPPGSEQGGFEAGIEMALRRILASPEFVFRFERAAEDVAPGEIYRFSDLELASRLSFFLWSSIPDDELLGLAVDDKLHEPATLRKQVRRMLADPRSSAFIENFAGQWLYLRNLKTKGGAVEQFPNFDDNLRQAFRTETELLFASIVREDRNLLDILTADYTFVERPAGAPLRHCRRLRQRVPPRAGRERGAPRRARPRQHPDGHVVAGAHVARAARRLGAREHRRRARADAAARTCPTLEEQAGTKNHPRTLREQMELHTTRPFCAGCHKIMDPVGFALENFDAIGQWRTEEHGAPIDATATARRRHGDRRRDRPAQRAAEVLRSLRADDDREAHDVRARPRRSSTTTCRPCARSRAARPRTTTGFRASSSASWRAPRFRCARRRTAPAATEVVARSPLSTD